MKAVVSTGQNVQLDNGSNNSHGYSPLDYSEMFQQNQRFSLFQQNQRFSSITFSKNQKLMENSEIACNYVCPQSLKTCEMLIVDMVGSVGLMEQTDRLAAKQCHWWLITSWMILSVEELEKPEATS